MVFLWLTATSTPGPFSLTTLILNDNLVQEAMGFQPRSLQQTPVSRPKCRCANWVFFVAWRLDKKKTWLHLLFGLFLVEGWKPVPNGHVVGLGRRPSQLSHRCGFPILSLDFGSCFSRWTTPSQKREWFTEKLCRGGELTCLKIKKTYL